MLLNIDFSSLHEILDNVSESIINGSLAGFVGIAKAIGAIGALFYIAYRVWQSLAMAEPIDVFPLLRPFALGLLIMNFGWVISAMDMVVSPLVNGTNVVVESGRDDLIASRLALQEAKNDKLEREGKPYLSSDEELEKKLDEYAWYQAIEKIGVKFEVGVYESKQWVVDLVQDILFYLLEAARLVLAVISSFFIIILTILGPVVFAFALFDGFQGSLVSWISRYINVSLWVPVGSILTFILNKIEIEMNNMNVKALASTESDSSTWFFIIFYIIGLIAFTTVPTVAGWVIEAGGGTGAMMNRLNAPGKAAASTVGSTAGAAGGAVAGMAASAGFQKIKSSLGSLYNINRNGRGGKGGNAAPQG